MDIMSYLAHQQSAVSKYKKLIEEIETKSDDTVSDFRIRCNKIVFDLRYMLKEVERKILEIKFSDNSNSIEIAKQAIENAWRQFYEVYTSSEEKLSK